MSAVLPLFETSVDTPVNYLLQGKYFCLDCSRLEDIKPDKILQSVQLFTS